VGVEDGVEWHRCGVGMDESLVRRPGALESSRRRHMRAAVPSSRSNRRVFRGALDRALIVGLLPRAAAPGHARDRGEITPPRVGFVDASSSARSNGAMQLSGALSIAVERLARTTASKLMSAY
jgi:hypothetical protein